MLPILSSLFRTSKITQYYTTTTETPSLPSDEIQGYDKLSTSLLKSVLFPYLGTHAVLILIGLLANFYIMPLMVSNQVLPAHDKYIQFPQALWLMWQHFDSGFYIDIAQHGYWPASTLHNHSNWVFYPFYPFLISCIGFLVGRSKESLSIAGLLIANVAALIAMIYLYLLVSKEFSRQIASRTVLYLSLFPMAFYLSAIYTEALFLMLAVMSIYYARKQAWWRAGLYGGLATLTRSQGIALFVPIAWEYLRVLSECYIPFSEERSEKFIPSLSAQFVSWMRGAWMAAKEIRNWFSAVALLLIPSGLLLFMIYAKIQTGDLMATFHANQWGWGRQLSYPWRLLIFSLRHPVIGEPMNWNFWILNMVTVFAFLGFTVWAFRCLPMIYALYTAVMILLPLSANLLNSLGRFSLMIFPAFILLALWSQEDKQQSKYTFIVVTFAVFQAAFMILYVLGIPAIA